MTKTLTTTVDRVALSLFVALSAAVAILGLPLLAVAANGVVG